MTAAAVWSARSLYRGAVRTEAGANSLLARMRRRVETILPRGAILLSALTFASYVMGLVRDRTFARTFGAGSDLDVYNAALVLPELALSILVVAGLASAFVPVFARLRNEDGGATEDFARSVDTTLMAWRAIPASDKRYQRSRSPNLGSAAAPPA